MSHDLFRDPVAMKRYFRKNIVLKLQSLPWCWERLRAGREGGDRGWDGWMASPTRWTCVWVNSGSWWWTGRSGVLRFVGSQRVGHDCATELNWLNTEKPGRNHFNQMIKFQNKLHVYSLCVCVICLREGRKGKWVKYKGIEEKCVTLVNLDIQCAVALYNYFGNFYLFAFILK